MDVQYVQYVQYVQNVLYSMYTMYSMYCRVCAVDMMTWWYDVEHDMTIYTRHSSCMTPDACSRMHDTMQGTRCRLQDASRDMHMMHAAGCSLPICTFIHCMYMPTYIYICVYFVSTLTTLKNACICTCIYINIHIYTYNIYIYICVDTCMLMRTDMFS